MATITSLDLFEQQKSPYGSFKSKLFHAIECNNVDLCSQYLYELDSLTSSGSTDNKLNSLYLVSEIQAVKDNKLGYLSLLQARNKLSPIGLYETINHNNSSLFWWYLSHFEGSSNNAFNLSLLMSEVLFRCVEHNNLQLFKDVETYILSHHPHIKGILSKYSDMFLVQASGLLLKYLLNECRLVVYTDDLMNHCIYKAYKKAIQSSSVECVQMLIDKWPVSDNDLVSYAICLCTPASRQTPLYANMYQIACMLLDLQDSLYEECECCITVDCVDLLKYCIDKCHTEFILEELLELAIEYNGIECFKWLLCSVNSDRKISEDTYLGAVSYLRFDMLLMLEQFNIQVKLSHVFKSYLNVCVDNQLKDRACHVYLLIKIWPEVRRIFTLYKQTSDIDNLHDLETLCDACEEFLVDTLVAYSSYDTELYLIALDLCHMIQLIVQAHSDYNHYSELWTFLVKLQQQRVQVVTNSIELASFIPKQVVLKHVCGGIVKGFEV